MRLVVHELISFVLEVFSRLCFALFLFASNKTVSSASLFSDLSCTFEVSALLAFTSFTHFSRSSRSYSEPQCVRKSLHNITF